MNLATLLPEPVGEFAALTLLALVQGLTEFLPVSSSGHLVLAQAAMGWSEPGLAIDVALHVGTLAAVCLVYRHSLLEIVRELCAGRPRELFLLFVGSVPTALIGLSLRESFESAFEDPRRAAGGLLVTAAVLLIGELFRRRKLRAASAEAPSQPAQPGPERPLGYVQALLIGTTQGLAIWPGLSRSGSTIAVGLMCGLSPQSAARFSFLLSIPAILGAASLRFLGDPDGNTPGADLLVWAGLFAGFVGWGALRTLLNFLGRGAFAWFSVYCTALGLGVLLFA